MTGVWQEAAELVENCRQAAQETQNSDGSLSVNFFGRPGFAADVKEALHSTGHTFEFLVLTSNDQQLREPWMVRAASFLCSLLRSTDDVELECGALYHGMHGLVLYRQRLFGPIALPTLEELTAPPAAAQP